VRGWRLTFREGIAGWVVENGECLIVPDTRADDRHFKGVDERPGVEVRSILSVPLRAMQDVIGVLQVVDSQVGRFDDRDLRFLEPLAASAAIAIQNARLYEHSRREVVERQWMEKRIEAAAQQWRTTIDAILDPICLLDREGVIQRCNLAMADFIGRPILEVVGRTCHELLDDVSAPIEGWPIARVWETRRRETTTLTIGQRQVTVVADPVLDDEDNVLGAVHILMDGLR
jgi:PAS domain-containing protein